METSEKMVNKAVNVPLTGGILGLLADSPLNTINRAIKRENKNGWRVRQIIPAESGNMFLAIFRFVILILTLFIYTPVNGFYIIFEKRGDNTLGEDVNEITCNECDAPVSKDDLFCQNCGNKLK